MVAVMQIRRHPSVLGHGLCTLPRRSPIWTTGHTLTLPLMTISRGVFPQLKSGGVNMGLFRERFDMMRHRFRTWRFNRRLRNMPPEDRRRLTHMLQVAVGEVERLL